ncbi:phosphoinositide 3-kinase adapter protein 1-like [Ylistrum balloti]|uniref:phosphoinositide 3-kinase adapter protein 1-like n=1 Tax=Ylistrum balloti TaxID=509963 RepID=UPI002905926A|nr:phosphoinositide 3-kinase adapter protein 1-like [Ylistrum balloti]
MPSISIIYHADDAEKWAIYLKKLLSKSEADISPVLCDFKRDSLIMETTIKNSTVVAVLISPCMLDDDIENAIEGLKDYENIVLLECFTTKEELESIFDKYTFFHSRKLLTVTCDKTEIYSLVSDLLEIVDSTEQAGTKRHLCQKKCTLKFRMMPDMVYQQPSVVYLNFEQEVQGTVTVRCGESIVSRIHTEAYNPFCVMFTAKNLSEGPNKVHVFIDDNQVGTCELKFQLPMLAAYECPSYLCQLLGICSDDRDTLDKTLVKIFKQSSPEDQSHISLLQTNMSETFQDSQSSSEVPTLLHFAAKNGLYDLWLHLMNLPRSSEVCRITNSNGKNVYDLAMESGVPDLEDYAKSFLETEAMELAFGSVYLNKKQLQKSETSTPESEIKIYSIPMDVPGPPAKPVEHEQPSSSKYDDRPPQPFPRVSTPVIQRRDNTENAQRYEHESVSGSRAMDELIEITKMTQEGQFTQEEALRLFESWKKRNSNPSASVRQKQQNLEELREHYIDVVKKSSEDEKSAFNGVFAMLKKRFSLKQKKKVNIPISEPTNWNEAHCYAWRTWNRDSSQSSASSGSRESQFSNCSVDSTMGASIGGSDSDESEEPTEVKFRKKTDSHQKSSKRDSYLRRISKSPELDVPPPKIPPRKSIPPPLPERKYSFT